MPPRGSTLKQARERVYDTGQRFPTDPGSWNPGDAARHARYLTGWANMNLRYRNGNPNGHDAYPKGTVFPRTGPVPQGIVVEPRDVRHGEPYTEGHPALPVIGSHANLDDVYKNAATLGQRLENEYRLRFVRMLGWGGMGAVALFDTRFKPNPAQDDTTYSFFAIKLPLRRGNKEDRDFRREKKYMAVSLLPSFPTSARESGASTDAQGRCLPRDTNGPFTSPRSSNGPPTGPGPERLRSSNELTDKFLPNNKATRAESRVRRSRRIKGENPVAEPHAISHQANPNPTQDQHTRFSAS